MQVLISLATLLNDTIAKMNEHKDNKEIQKAFANLIAVVGEEVSKECRNVKDYGELIHGLNKQEREQADKQYHGSPFSYKIGAIKRYRERTGASLLQAKNAVENYYLQTGRDASGNRY